MAVTAGYSTKVQVSASASSGYETLGRCTSITLNESKEQIDITPLSGTASAQVLAAGLAKGSVTLTCFYEPADAGQAIVIARYGDGADCYFQIKWDNSAGDNVACKILGQNKKSAPSGGVMVDWTIVATGAVDQSMH